MRKALLTLALSLALFACATSGGHSGPEAGGAFSPFRAADISGQIVDLAAHTGKDVIVVSFWASWCEPCKAEMPFLQRFHERYKNDGLVVASVSIDGPDTAAEVAPYIRKQGYTFPVVVDEDGAISQTLNPSSTAPFVIIVARDGTVARRIAGFQPSEANALEAELKTMLGLPQ